MAKQIVTPRIRGFICLDAHPTGCATNVQRQVDLMRGLPGTGWGDVLVVGSSTGYGLSSLIAAVFGYGARGMGVCLERPAQRGKTASGGWYNMVEVQRLAAASGRQVATVNGDAYSNQIKEEVIRQLKQRGGKLDCVVYSLASPKRTDPETGTTHSSVLKPIGAPYQSKSINLGNDQVVTVSIDPATDADIEATRKVMGGEDWDLWLRALLDEGLLANGCKTVAYSYIGPELTYPIYRSGTIGRAKEHLEATARSLDATLKSRLQGAAFVSVNKALVTQASSAIPVVPLYISALYKVMKSQGIHEGTGEQMRRLFEVHLGPGRTPTLDAEGRIRIDDLEMRPDIQRAVSGLWERVSTENLLEVTDYAGFKREFRGLFGFEVEGVDYDQPVEIDLPL
jgi:enoyl-[acyl-carrier protein] reductase/trans-2-enoyl-CoA reductase (NAD+)